MKKNITVATLGSWQLIPELYGFINSNDFNLYKNSSKIGEITKRIKPTDEIWLVGTGGEYSKNSLQKIQEWKLKNKIKTQFRFFSPEGINDISSMEECNYMSDLIYRVVYNAKESCMGGQFVLSLAGGRKTMSADLQESAYLFGCDFVIHIIDSLDRDKINELRNYEFLDSFPKKFADYITPIVYFSKIETSPIFLTRENKEKLTKFRFSNISEINSYKNDRKFYEFVVSEKNKGRNFVFNIAEPMYGDSKSSNFTALYSLHPSKINKLKNIMFGLNREEDEGKAKLLQKIPKAELHCHLGGILDAKDLIEVALVNSREIEIYYNKNYNYKKFINDVKHYVLENNLTGIEAIVPSPKELRKKFEGVQEPYAIAGFISCFKENEVLLDKYIFGNNIKENEFFGIGINAYEKLGDLQGSGILQNEKSIRHTVRILTEKAKKHNVKYLEIRCSPANYTRGGLSKEDVYRFIKEELEKDLQCTYSIIFIASRHGDLKNIEEHVKLGEYIINTGNEGRVKLVGFDVAGDEKVKSPEDLRESLLPIMKKSLKITIHAGETVDVKSIWGAVYHLNAERVGHGLKLKQNTKLFSHFLDRKITLELCPSSNFQIVGYEDNIFKIKGVEEYPLRVYLDGGLKVCVNTDNPGISRTNFTKELIKAAQMTKGGLSLWDILILIRNGFKASFIDYGQRREILRNAENEIIDILNREDIFI